MSRYFYICLIKGMNIFGFFLFLFLLIDIICLYLKMKLSFVLNEKIIIIGCVLICFV